MNRRGRTGWPAEATTVRLAPRRGILALRPGQAARTWLPPGVMFAVAVAGIGAASYWRDEAATLSAVRRPLPLLWLMLGRTDAVHGAYYLAMWPLVRAFGGSELVARLPSAVAMAAAAAGVAAIGRRLVSPRAGLAAGLMFALFPVTSRYGQEARSYAMVMALAVLASYLLVRAGESAATRRRWLAGYALAVALMGWLNLLSLLLIPAHAGTLALWRRSRGAGRAPPEHESFPATRRDLADWLAAAGAACIMVSPIIVLAWQQRHGTARFLVLTTVTAAANVPGRLSGSWPVLVAVLPLSAAAIASRGAAMVRLTRLCLPWLLLPPLLLLAVSTVTPVYDPRYILFCVPALALLAGSGLEAVAGRVGRHLHRGRRPPGRRPIAGGPAVIAAGLAVVALAGLPSQLGYRAPDGHLDNIRLVARILAGREHPGDAVLYAPPWWRQIGAAYPPGFARLNDISVAVSPARAGNFTGTQLPASAVRAKLSTLRRVWLITEVKRFRPDPVPAVAGWSVAARWRAGTFLIVLYRHLSRRRR